MMNPMYMMQQYQQFRNTISGNPNQIIQNMMNSGQINQQQYQQAASMAQQYRGMFGFNQQGGNNYVQ